MLIQWHDNQTIWQLLKTWTQNMLCQCHTRFQNFELAQFPEFVLSSTNQFLHKAMFLLNYGPSTYHNIQWDRG